MINPKTIKDLGETIFNHLLLQRHVMPPHLKKDNVAIFIDDEDEPGAFQVARILTKYFCPLPAWKESNYIVALVIAAKKDVEDRLAYLKEHPSTWQDEEDMQNLLFEVNAFLEDALPDGFVSGDSGEKE